jgi:hypothetical protein
MSRTGCAQGRYLVLLLCCGSVFLSATHATVAVGAGASAPTAAQHVSRSVLRTLHTIRTEAHAHVVVALSGVVVYGFRDNSTLVALNATTFKELWRSSDLLFTGPLVPSGSVFLGVAYNNEQHLVSVDARTGERLCRLSLPGTLASAAAVDPYGSGRVAVHVVLANNHNALLVYTAAACANVVVIDVHQPLLQTEVTVAESHVYVLRASNNFINTELVGFAFSANGNGTMLAEFTVNVQPFGAISQRTFMAASDAYVAVMTSTFEDIRVFDGQTGVSLFAVSGFPGTSIGWIFGQFFVLESAALAAHRVYRARDGALLYNDTQASFPAMSQWALGDGDKVVRVHNPAMDDHPWRFTTVWTNGTNETVVGTTDANCSVGFAVSYAAHGSNNARVSPAIVVWSSYVNGTDYWYTLCVVEPRSGAVLAKNNYLLYGSTVLDANTNHCPTHPALQYRPPHLGSQFFALSAYEYHGSQLLFQEFLPT